jgi:hypothetical protein
MPRKPINAGKALAAIRKLYDIELTRVGAR